MRYTVSIFAAFALVGLIWTPPQARAQSKEFKEMQREFYDIGQRLDEIKKGQDDRIGQLEALIKQMMDANAKLADQVHMLQDRVSENAQQQEKRIAGPIDQIRKSQDELWQSFQGIQGSLDNIKGRQDKLDSSLTNVSGTLGLMRDDMSKAAAPPSAPAVTGSAAPSADPATLAYLAAEKDHLAGKLNFALREFMDLAAAYPNAPEAPMAIFKTGVIYAEYPQPEDALKAFDRVLEQFGDNPFRPAAQFAKAEQLAALGKNAEAAREFNNFAKLYPDDENAAVAKQRAAELTGGRAAPAKPNSKGKGKR